MAAWIVSVLHENPFIAIFLALGVGFLVGPITVAGFNLGNVTATLLAGVLVGQIGVQVSNEIKDTFFILFLFAVGYGVGPQFVRGLAKDGMRQVVFAVIILALCLVVPLVCALIAQLPLGYAAGMYAGSQTISAAIGVASGQIQSLGLPAGETRSLVDQIPVAYAVTYIFGTIGSAIILAQLGPRLIGVDLQEACNDYEKSMGAGDDTLSSKLASAYHKLEIRAFRIDSGSDLEGLSNRQILKKYHLLVERVRRGDEVLEADDDTVLRNGDVAAIAGRRGTLVEDIETHAVEVDDVELLSIQIEKLDVVVTNRGLAGKTLRELDVEPWAHNVYVTKMMRSLVEIPVLPKTTMERGDVVTIVGSRRHVEAAVKVLGHADRPTEASDIALLSWGIVLGCVIGAASIIVGGIPIGLSTAGGALLAGLIIGWLRTAHPLLSGIPGPALWMINTLGLNVFIAVVGINAGPAFVAGLKQAGLSLLLWGAVATTIPMIAAVYIGYYLFKFHPAILFGVCAGVRTTTAALGMITEVAKSKVPALGYGMPYAIGNTLLTIFGLVIVLLMAR